jgi:hypothetical protein
MPIDAVFVGREASRCYGNAARSWSDGINTCTIGAGCGAMSFGFLALAVARTMRQIKSPGQFSGEQF